MSDWISHLEKSMGKFFKFYKNSSSNIYKSVQANESRVQIRRKFKIHLDGARGLPPKVKNFFVITLLARNRYV